MHMGAHDSLTFAMLRGPTSRPAPSGRSPAKPQIRQRRQISSLNICHSYASLLNLGTPAIQCSLAEGYLMACRAHLLGLLPSLVYHLEPLVLLLQLHTVLLYINECFMASIHGWEYHRTLPEGPSRCSILLPRGRSICLSVLDKGIACRPCLLTRC